MTSRKPSPAPQRPDFSFEDRFKGIVCGVDEVGRGPLAGPVVAAAVVLKRKNIPADVLAQINDSKALTAQKREYLYGKIHEYAHVCITECGVDEIDEINILQASLRAMAKAVEGLDIRPQAALIDGNKAPKLACATKTIVKGDSRSLSIAAASIVAKHYRDVLMCRHALEFPQYGWESNAGYGTAQHLKAIQIHGVTPLHRRSFAPVSKHLLKVCSANS
jgi:ribonuclease HII